jgi:hypothetical protein
MKAPQNDDRETLNYFFLPRHKREQLRACAAKLRLT